MEPDCFSIKEAIARLDSIAPGVPMLALGQTVFWDEPMKAGIALSLEEVGSERRFVAGVHDTDYFAKLPHGERRPGEFRSFPHNGTTTKALWSAAGEFSALFGSETVISRSDLLSAGTRLERIQDLRPEFLDQITEAFGWRGVVSLDDDPPIVREVPLRNVFEPLQKTLHWAIEASLDSVHPDDQSNAQKVVDDIWRRVCDAYERQENGTITDFYEALLPDLYELTAGKPARIESTRTSTLLQFNRETCGRKRFALVGHFLRLNAKEQARIAYNEGIRGSEIYGLTRFGTGAIPFDLVVPGHGRGTLRIGSRGLVVSTPKPLFATFRKPIESIEDLAAVIEDRFGPNCTLIGKAVTLIGMLATEFVFVFHAGASSYVRHTQEFHRRLDQAGLGLDWHPIMRIEYSPWDALRAVDRWLRLPKDLQPAFGAEEVCAKSFASRWKDVAREQKVLLAELGELRRPVDLIRFLDQHLGGAWNALAKEYLELFSQMKSGLAKIDEVRQTRLDEYGAFRTAKQRRVEAERRLGEHFRARVFDRTASKQDLLDREELQSALQTAVRACEDHRARLKALLREQASKAGDDSVRKLHERRRNIELEAEIQRVKLVRSSILASTNLVHAGHRPSAWWFPLVSPDGAWFRETIDGAKCWFEPLSETGNRVPA